MPHEGPALAGEHDDDDEMRDAGAEVSGQRDMGRDDDDEMQGTSASGIEAEGGGDAAGARAAAGGIGTAASDEVAAGGGGSEAR